MKKSLLVALIILSVGGSSRAQTGPAQGGGLLGGGVRSRLQNLRNRMTNKDPSVQYNPSVLALGTPRAQVIAAFGQPNGSQTAPNGMPEDVYAFFPDGSKYVDPQITAGTIAAAVFTGGMSLATKAAKNTIQQNQLTLYRVHYDANQNIQSVQVIPPTWARSPVPRPPRHRREQVSRARRVRALRTTNPRSENNSGPLSLVQRLSKNPSAARKLHEWNCSVRTFWMPSP